MKIILENTSKIVELNGVPARVWEGRTESGIPMHAYITRVALTENAGASAIAEFERELEAVRPPSVDIAAIPNRLVL